MDEIIDVADDVGSFAGRLVDAGVKTVIRYYNHRNVSHPTKCLTPDELRALHAAGLSVAVVFEQRAGAPLGRADHSHIEDFGEANGVRDAQRALELAGQLGQPEGSAIYFAVDHDFDQPSQLAQIAQYFEKAKETLAGRYRVGVYGSGVVGRLLKDRGLVDLIWLAGARRWSGTQDALTAGRYTIFQKHLEQTSDFGRFGYDGNILNPDLSEFGQFGEVSERPTETGAVGRFRVIAERALNLRSGPGLDFDIKRSVSSGTIVTGVGREGRWMKVDLDGDGEVDGYMSERLLEPVSLEHDPAPPPSDPATGVRPIDVAREEMEMGVAEIPGPQVNPRITVYHQTTTGGRADERLAWCSSFVNFCVEKAGLRGTRNRMAISWNRWGRNVTASPEVGDIVVFRSGDPGSQHGHVGFYIGQEGGKIRVLGGNQGDRVSIAPYPRDGMSGGLHFTLLSIRRGTDA